MYKQMKPQLDAALKELEKNPGLASSTLGPLEYPDWSETNHSHLRKCLTKRVFEELKNKKTPRGVTLRELINCGLVNQDTNVGLYVGDQECLKVFSPLVLPIIEECHKPFKIGQDKHTTDLNPDHLKLSGGADPMKKYIVQTWISVARNLPGYSFMPTITTEDRLDIEKKVGDVLVTLGGDLAGEYYSLGSKLDDMAKEKLTQDLQLFKPGNPLLEAAGISRDFPEGRAVFINETKTLRVWVNEEDHVRVISQLPNGNIKQILERLFTALSQISSKLDFLCDEGRLGFLTSCPTLMGTGLRLLVLAKIPNAQNHPNFATIGPKFRVDCRCFNDADVFAIAAKGLLGKTEVERIAEFYEAVKLLLEMESEMEMKKQIGNENGPAL